MIPFDDIGSPDFFRSYIDSPRESLEELEKKALRECLLSRYDRLLKQLEKVDLSDQARDRFEQELRELIVQVGNIAPD